MSARRLPDFGARHAWVVAAITFMVLLAGWAATLARHAGQRDVVIGSPIANRARPELEELVGYFANTLALRIDLGDDPSFEVLLVRTKERLLGAYMNQDLPFERLVQSLQKKQDLGG